MIEDENDFRLESFQEKHNFYAPLWFAQKAKNLRRKLIVEKF